MLFIYAIREQNYDLNNTGMRELIDLSNNSHWSETDKCNFIDHWYGNYEAIKGYLDWCNRE